MDEKTMVQVADQVRHLVPNAVNRSVHSVKDGPRTVSQHAVIIRSEQIALAMPMDEVMFSKWFRYYVQMDVMPWDIKLFKSSTYLPDARNDLHRQFIDSGVEYMLMVDSDTAPPYDVINRLLAHKKPVVCGWYRAKYENDEETNNPPDHTYPVVYDYERYAAPDKWHPQGQHQYKMREEPGTGLEQVDGVGAGCMLMRRDVAKALGKFPYDMNTGGEDLVLCTKLRELGIPIFMDWDVRCKHVGTHEWR